MRLIILPFLLFSATVSAQSSQPRVSEGKAPARTEFVSYLTRPDAEAGAKERSKNYFSLLSGAVRTVDESCRTAYSASISVPEWLERDVFLRVAAGAPYTVFVNNEKVGYSDDVTPAEFDISRFSTDYKIRIETYSLYELSVCSQPRVRVEDYIVDATVSDTQGVLKLAVAVKNGYNYSEPVSVGYDIYSPAGTLLYYDKRPRELMGGGRDTVRLEFDVSKVAAWSPASPNLYRMMIILWHGSRVIEYIPFKVGFTPRGAEYNLEIVRRAIAENALVAYDGGDVSKLKGRVVTVGYPQGEPFYEACDKTGVYVIDQANIDFPAEIGAVNDPRLLPVFLERVQAMVARDRNHVCVVGWSPAAASTGNGYNMYKCYQWLKAASPDRPVIYRGAGGEWDSDL